MSRATAVALALASAAAAPAAPGGQPMDHAALPADLAAFLEGSWDLGDTYRVTFARSGGGLRAHQEAVVRLRGRVERDSEVRYDGAGQTLRFDGLGAIHKTVVTLRRSGEQLEYSFGVEKSPGHWTQTTWETARRAQR